jgi:glycopeptide antibiotics resistance protein
MNRKGRLSTILLWSAFSGYILLMVWELFLGNYRTSGGFRSANLLPFYTIIGYIRFLRYYSLETLLINLAGNIIIFIPLGFFLPALLLRLRRWKVVFLLGTVLIIMVEVFQYVFYVGILDMDDIILNSMGVMTGYAAYTLVSGVLHKNASSR